MKKIIYICFLCFLCHSCEDVVEVDLNTAEPRLVIDASLNWPKGASGQTQQIRLTLTAPYFDNGVPPATGATVIVTDVSNNTFNFIEQGDTGIYQNDSFLPAFNQTYTLTINYSNETYTATEKLIPVSAIDRVEQKNDGGFSGDEIEIKAYYTDPPGVQNFYLFEFITNPNTISLEVYNDEFIDGNDFFGFYSDEDLKSGDELVIRNSGISERTYEFLNILLQQSDEDAGDPFQTQPTSVRGNCINQTNPNNYPLGYFRVSEIDSFTYVVE